MVNVGTRGRYDSLTTSEIFIINNYCRTSLWRRAKFLNDRQLTLEFDIVCPLAGIKKEDGNNKFVDVLTLINSNMNYRRSYSNKLMREKMIGASTA